MKQIDMLKYVKCPKECGHLVACEHCENCPYHWHVDYGHSTVYCKYGMTKEEMIDMATISTAELVAELATRDVEWLKLPHHEKIIFDMLFDRVQCKLLVVRE